ncbi:MAG: hypothetical protein R3208_01545 [Ketobacteraceae bacterium]|nr:hypothetical protein [Ketobacteraceae bacterium]
MKPAKQIVMMVLLASVLSACKSMPEAIWSTGEQPPPAEEQPAPAPEPEPQPAPPSLHQQIEIDLLSNRLSRPKGNNAIEKIEELRRLNPDDPAIAKFEQEIIDRYLVLADRRLTKNNPPKRRDLEVALKYINTARSLGAPSEALDEKEAMILELLDIMVQQERLEKARQESAREETPPEPEPAAEEALEESIEPPEQARPLADNPNFLNLKQNQIDARSQEINLQLDSISSRIISENAAVIIHARSMDDFRYLSASLRTSLYWVDPDFVVTAEPHISDSVNPGIEIITY